MSKLNEVRVNVQDEDVCQRVENFLKAQHFPAFRNLDIDVAQGTVTLSGQVSTYYEKQVALTSCQTVKGVKCLVDQIEVTDHLILGHV